nr:hypothetical protein [Tanacetum cinerariifolium]
GEHGPRTGAGKIGLDRGPNWSKMPDRRADQNGTVRTCQRRKKVVSKVVDVQEVEATALAGRDRYIEGYEVKGHQKHLKLAEGHV